MGSKTAEKNSAQINKQTDRQTNRHYENNGHLVVNQLLEDEGARVPVLAGDANDERKTELPGGRTD